jgi:hypothetical protein
MRKKSHPLYKVPKIEFISAIQQAESRAQALEILNIANRCGSTYRILKELAIKYCLQEELIRIDLTNNEARRLVSSSRGKPLEEYMIKNSSYSRGTLKQRILKEGVIPYECLLCKQNNIWNEELLVLILDHINGINNDHRLENLRFLCPNCNSQTATFAGRNVSHKKKQNHCQDCQEKISATAARCRSCARQADHSRRKVLNRPSKEVLLDQIKLWGYSKTGRHYGVTDNAIRKWLK